MPRAGLSRRAVIHAAIGVVDDGGGRGFDDLTLAAVAARSGVAVPSLYKHVASLADLRCGVAVACVEQLTAELTTAALGRSGSQALHAVAGSYRSWARRYPGRYMASQHARPADAGGRGPAAEELAQASGRAVGVVAAVLAGYGVPGARMVDAIRTVRAALHGFVMLEIGGGFALPEDIDGSFRFLVETLDAGVQR